MFPNDKHCTVDVSERILKQVGFLSLKMEGGFYRFAHLTFQEFFAAKCLAAHRIFGAKNHKKKSAERFIVTNRSFPHHETVPTFWLKKSVQPTTALDLTDSCRLHRPMVDGMHVQLALFKMKLVDAFVSSSQRISHVLLSERVARSLIPEFSSQHFSLQPPKLCASNVVTFAQGSVESQKRKTEPLCHRLCSQSKRRP